VRCWRRLGRGTTTAFRAEGRKTWGRRLGHCVIHRKSFRRVYPRKRGVKLWTRPGGAIGGSTSETVANKGALFQEKGTIYLLQRRY